MSSVGVVTRAAKTLARTRARTLLLVVVLGLAAGLFAALVQSAVAVERELTQLERTYATQIEVRRAGATQMGEGVDLLPEDVFDPIESWPNVIGVDKYVLVREVDSTIPEAPIAIFNGVPVDGTLRVTTHGAEGRVTLIAGRAFVPDDATRNVALVGKRFAETRGLVEDAEPLRGSSRDDYGTFARNNTTFRVVGIFETGFAFGDTEVMLPYESTQRAFGLKGKTTTAWIRVDEVQNTLPIANRMEAELDPVIEPLGVDVLAGDRAVGAVVATLEEVRRTGLVGAGFAGLIAALVIGFALAATTLDRTREIGTLRALGASPRDVAAQFVSESALVSVVGAVVGVAVFATLGPWMVERLLGLAGRGGGLAGHAAESPLSGVQIGLDLTLELVLAMAILAVVGALAGSLFPVRYASRLDPAQALRGGGK